MQFPGTCQASVVHEVSSETMFRRAFSWEAETQRDQTHSQLTVTDSCPHRRLSQWGSSLCILPPSRETEAPVEEGTWQTGLRRRFPGGQAGPSQAVGKSRQA